MIKNTDLIPALTGESFTLIVGVPRTRVKCTEVPNGTLKKFTLPDGAFPIYPRSGMVITPTKADITVEYLKGTTYTSADADVKQINSITDTDSGLAAYKEIEFTSTVASATADYICVTVVEEVKPYIAQTLKASIKQTTKTYNEIGSSMTHTSYTAQEITIDQDNLMGDMDVLQALLFETYAGTGTPETGYDAYTMISQPKDIYCYIPVVGDDAEIKGRFYFQGKIVPTGLIDLKAGDNAQFSLQISIMDNPIMIVPEP